MLSLDRIWIQPAATLRRMFVHTSALARRASDHLPVVAELDLTDATAVGLTGALAAGQTDASTTGLANASAAGSISR
jgi:hypothetical protein